jgi:hypothetical protein
MVLRLLAVALSIRIHMLSKVCSALLLACAAACAPIVTHTPRVEEGFSFFGTAGGGGRLCDSVGCDTQLVPQQGLGVRYGQAATATRPGVSAAVTFSTAIVSSELDLYLQAPTAVGLDVGAGVLSALTHDMPYVQVGRMREDGSGWYTTQGYAFLSSRPPEWTLEFDGSPTADEVEPRYWAPTVAYRTRGRAGVHVYLSGAFGSAKAVVYSADSLATRTTTRQPVRVVMMGIVFDVQPVRPRPPAPRPTPAVPPTGLPR